MDENPKLELIPAHSNVAVQLRSYVQSVKKTEFLLFFAISVTRDEVIGLLGVFEAEAKGEKMDRSKFRDFLHKEFGLTEDIMLDRGWYRPSFQGVTLHIIQLKRLIVPQIKLLYTEHQLNTYQMTFCGII